MQILRTIRVENMVISAKVGVDLAVIASDVSKVGVVRFGKVVT